MFGSLLKPATEAKAARRRYTLWIDGVGTWQILTANSVTIGRVQSVPSILSVPKKTEGSSNEADIAVMANLSRCHVQFERMDETWVLTPHASTTLFGRAIDDQVVLPDQCEVTLRDSVRLGFSVPTPLSASARLQFESGHRPQTSVDGFVLMAQACLLGPGSDNHIRCSSWPGSVVLVQTTTGGLAVKSRLDLLVNGKRINGKADVNDGSVVTGPDLRFRLEAAGET